MQIINVESDAAKITVSYQLFALCTHLGREIIIYEYLVECATAAGSALLSESLVTFV